MAIIEVAHLRKTYSGRTVLDDVSFHVGLGLPGCGSDLLKVKAAATKT
jgi:hypothetical protein